MRDEKKHREETSKKAREYLRVAREVVGLDEWREIIERAREDALNNAGTHRHHARIFLRDTLIGKSDRGDAWGGRDDPLDDSPGYPYDDLPDEELDAIIAAGEGREDAEGADREGAASSA